MDFTDLLKQCGSPIEFRLCETLYAHLDENDRKELW